MTYRDDFTGSNIPQALSAEHGVAVSDLNAVGNHKRA
jgi:hypothetical protein